MSAKRKVPEIRNPLLNLVGYQLRRASAAMFNDLAVDLVALNLKPTSMSVLIVVGENEGVTQSGLGQLLGIKSANMAPLVAELEARGLMQRLRLDGRSHNLRLTADGRELCRQALDRIAANEVRFLSALQTTNRAALIAALEAIWTLPRKVS